MIDQLQFQLSQLAYSLENHRNRPGWIFVWVQGDYWRSWHWKKVRHHQQICRKFHPSCCAHPQGQREILYRNPITMSFAECFQSDLQGIIQENWNESEIREAFDWFDREDWIPPDQTGHRNDIHWSENSVSQSNRKMNGTSTWHWTRQGLPFALTPSPCPFWQNPNVRFHQDYRQIQQQTD